MAIFGWKKKDTSIVQSKITIEDFKDGKLYILRQDLSRKNGKGEWTVNDEKWRTEHMICKIFKKGKKDNG